MKRLIIIRHSKAEGRTPELSDFERSLTTEGKEHSGLMSEMLITREKSLGMVLASPAFRAIETALIFCNEYNHDYENIRICPELYLMHEPYSYLSFFRSLNNENEIFTLFGHNPMLTEITRLLTDQNVGDIPKTGVVCLSFKTDNWSSIEPGSGVIEYFLSPKSLI